VQTPLADRPGVSIRRVNAVVNPLSGGVGPGAADDLESLLAEFGVEYAVSQAVDGDVEGAARAAIDAGPDLVVVLAGDGTARLVADLCGPGGPLVAPLSGGTMNKLGHAIYGPARWRDALAGVLADGRARWMPRGEVGGHGFYCSAVLGSPVLWAKAREAIRVRRFGRAWVHAVIAFRRTFVGRLHYEFGGAETGRGLAIGLICPIMSRALDDEAGALEAAVLDVRNAKAGLRLALTTVLGDWRDDPDVTVRPCVGGRVWARESIHAMLDGELFRLGRETEIAFEPRAFRALAPASGQDGAR
jgi:diacylglycerol kinase family enzyme